MSVDVVIKYAIYGGNDGVCQARDITQKLQSRIDDGESVITFDSDTFGDAFSGIAKGFSVVVEMNDEEYVYSGVEGDTVNFSYMPINGEGRYNLKLLELNAVYNVLEKQLFDSCSVTLQNLAAESFPNDDNPSAWVWLDFYFVGTADTLQSTVNYIKIGELPVLVSPVMLHSETQVVDIAASDLYDMAQYVLDSRNLVSTGDYYLYAQVRNAKGLINSSIGTFSSETYAYSAL